MRRDYLSVVIPTYNEAARLGPSLESLRAFLERRFSRFELIVVDDGSGDGTAALARGFAGVRVLELGFNRGKGAAVREGMLAADGEFVLFTDADLSTPIEQMEPFLERLKAGADLVIGSRALPGSELRVRQSRLREGMGKVFNRLMRALCGLPYRDTQCGFKAFTREAARAIFSRARIDGFAFDVEALSIARTLGLKVEEHPVRWINSPLSRVRIVAHSLEMLRDVLRIRLGRRS